MKTIQIATIEACIATRKAEGDALLLEKKEAIAYAAANATNADAMLAMGNKLKGIDAKLNSISEQLALLGFLISTAA